MNETIVAKGLAKHLAEKFEGWGTDGIIVKNKAQTRDHGYAFGDCASIVWEGGPYDWVYNFPFGGVEEEFGFRLEDVSDRFDDGVWVEAQNNWSVVIWNG